MQSRSPEVSNTWVGLALTAMGSGRCKAGNKPMRTEIKAKVFPKTTRLDRCTKDPAYSFKGDTRPQRSQHSWHGMIVGRQALSLLLGLDWSPCSPKADGSSPSRSKTLET